MSRSKKTGFKTAASLIGAGLLVGAIGRELSLPKAERTWHGRVIGVPYDLRPPTLERLQSSWCAPNNPIMFTPKSFGVGWDLNVGRLFTLLKQR